MTDYQRYQASINEWIDIYNCPIKGFRRSYPRVKTRIKPEYMLPINGMINRFLITN